MFVQKYYMYRRGHWDRDESVRMKEKSVCMREFICKQTHCARTIHPHHLNLIVCMFSLYVSWWHRRMNTCIQENMSCPLFIFLGSMFVWEWSFECSNKHWKFKIYFEIGTWRMKKWRENKKQNKTNQFEYVNDWNANIHSKQRLKSHMIKYFQ